MKHHDECPDMPIESHAPYGYISATTFTQGRLLTSSSVKNRIQTPRKASHTQANERRNGSNGRELCLVNAGRRPGGHNHDHNNY
jgi:hypothetical protein